MSIDYSERIPNNVDLAEDRRLQRAPPRNGINGQPLDYEYVRF